MAPRGGDSDASNATCRGEAPYGGNHVGYRRAVGHGVEQLGDLLRVADVDIDVHVELALRQSCRVEVLDPCTSDRGPVKQDPLARVGIPSVDEHDPRLVHGRSPSAAGRVKVPMPAARARGMPPR